jgi:lactate permease
MSLLRAFIPWILLIAFALLTNLVPPIFKLLFVDLTFPITIGSFTLNTRFLWQAYTWVLISVLLSFLFLPSDRTVLKNSILLFRKRALRPMLSSAIFFAIAWILNYSPSPDSTLNMVRILSEFTSSSFGVIFPLIVPLIGFFGGFVSGSETSSIVMFTRYHVQTSNSLGLDPMTISTASGVGGGLASVITPAKVQNAAATIDHIGIEGKVIRKTIFISLSMISILSCLTLLWAPEFPLINTSLIFILVIIYLGLVIILFVLGLLLKEKQLHEGVS